MNKYYGVLLETVSIQNYIFQSNKLKQNLGASHLIQNIIFDDLLKETVNKIFENDDFDFDAWKNKPSEILIHTKPFETAYIGGGNALLLFQDLAKAKEFIKVWTLKLLRNAPGVTTAVGTGLFDPENFRESLIELFNILRDNKAQYIPQTTLPRHGITAECNYSGLSADVFNESDNKYMSSVINAKIEASTQGREDFHKIFQKQLANQYCFTNEFNKLGSISGEDSHIAVVHIDGNRMADRFRQMDTLENIRNLSISVHKATKDAFSDLLNSIVEDYPMLMGDLGFESYNKEDKYWAPMDKKYDKKILPLTPIVLGGDDLTFVCDGKLGIYFSELFINAFEKKSVSDQKKLSACAGIAVTKVSYPFYRGYQMAESLCSSAKALNDGKNDPKELISALDFQISMGSISGSLKNIRKNHFEFPQVPGGNLLYRPYKLVPKESKDEQSLELIIQKTNELGKTLPNNKLKELRNVLMLSDAAGKQFVKEIEYRSRALPDLGNRGYNESLFVNQSTIYYDMIELIEFYPKSVMEKRGEQ